MNNLYYDDNLYGNYRNMTFSEIFDSAAVFTQFFTDSGITSPLTSAQLTELFYLLYGEYGNSPIASSDINRFKYKMMTISNTAGAIYFKKMEVQNKLLTMSDKDLLEGNTSIYNIAYNPSTAPTTETQNILQTINQQNTNISKRGNLEAYAALVSLLDENLTQDFLNKYRNLFLQFVSPEEALWYETLKPNIPIEQEDN